MDQENEAAQIILEETLVIAYRPGVANFLGSIEAAIFFQQLSHWSKYVKREDGFFYKSAIEIEQETCISERTQRRCRKILTDLGWIDAEKRMANGHPTYHYRVNVQATSVIFPTGKTPVPTSKNASSITLDNNIIYNTDTQNLIDKVYFGYLLNFRIDKDDYNLSSPERRLEILDKAKKKYKLTDKRKAKIASRLDDAGYEMIKQAIINCAKSDFHRGESDRSNGWSANLEWICNSYEKVEEWANRNEKN